MSFEAYQRIIEDAPRRDGLVYDANKFIMPSVVWASILWIAKYGRLFGAHILDWIANAELQVIGVALLG
ncbi:hypothetical protein Pyn_00560 [Prunus yedoensis var. nudiflora]|uniref:Uncharacterized protein n=1 Tax=Prunus yedoensis var. nudiflora TaxID=2094558 RepID=A0A314UZQ1_PRUYE|nr:hypothetical protein Pyn_00560 [Prunus yedoensis var. nudiflora]